MAYSPTVLLQSLSIGWVGVREGHRFRGLPFARVVRAILLFWRLCCAPCTPYVQSGRLTTWACRDSVGALAHMPEPYDQAVT